MDRDDRPRVCGHWALLQSEPGLAAAQQVLAPGENDLVHGVLGGLERGDPTLHRGAWKDVASAEFRVRWYREDLGAPHAGLGEEALAAGWGLVRLVLWTLQVGQPQLDCHVGHPLLGVRVEHVCLLHQGGGVPLYLQDLNLEAPVALGQGDRLSEGRWGRAAAARLRRLRGLDGWSAALGGLCCHGAGSRRGRCHRRRGGLATAGGAGHDAHDHEDPDQAEASDTQFLEHLLPPILLPVNVEFRSLTTTSLGWRGTRACPALR